MLKMKFLCKNNISFTRVYLKSSHSLEYTKIAIYVIDKNTREVIKKYKYQSSPCFLVTEKRNEILNSIMRVYILDKDNKKKVFDFEASDLNFNLSLLDFLDYFSIPQKKNDVILTIKSFIINDNFVSDFLGVRNTNRLADENIEIIKNYFEYLVFRTEVQRNIRRIALKWLIFFQEIKEENKNKYLLLVDDLLEKKDFYFYKSLIYFRLGYTDLSKIYCRELIGYKNELESFERGGLAYISLSKKETFNLAYIKDLITKETCIINKLDGDFYDKPVILISCDYGYYCAYFKSFSEKILNYDNLLHCHVTFKDTEELNSFLENYNQNAMIGISYDVQKTFNKTYFSIRRYLMLPFIKDLYQRDVIVADIDLNIDQNYDYLSSCIGNNFVALMRRNGDLPWNTYLAGFNFFGKKAISGRFTQNLVCTIFSLYVSGRDLWMLDQVALLLTVESTDNSNLLYIMNFLKKGIKQVRNRREFRKIANSINTRNYK